MTTTTEPSQAAGEMPFMEHLAELRTRIIRAALAVMIGGVVVMAAYPWVMQFLLHPYALLCEHRGASFCGLPDGAEVRLYMLDPIEGLGTRMRVSFYGGIILALPVITWQLWRFIVPALHKNEKRYALSFVLGSTGLFLFGGMIAFSTLEKALEFLISFAGPDVSPTFQVHSYISLITLMFVAFGVGFNIPLLLVMLELIGVLSWRTLLGAWRYAIVGTVVVAAVITPSGDPISLAALSVPMIVLYFVAILIGWLIQRGRDVA